MAMYRPIGPRKCVSSQSKLSFQSSEEDVAHGLTLIFCILTVAHELMVETDKHFMLACLSDAL